MWNLSRSISFAPWIFARFTSDVSLCPAETSFLFAKALFCIEICRRRAGLHGFAGLSLYFVFLGSWTRALCMLRIIHIFYVRYSVYFLGGFTRTSDLWRGRLDNTQYHGASTNFYDRSIFKTDHSSEWRFCSRLSVNNEWTTILHYELYSGTIPVDTTANVLTHTDERRTTIKFLMAWLA